MPHFRSGADWTPLLAAAVLATAVVLLFMTSPRHEDFWWTDAATFALNGDLVRDYIASGFPDTPMAFAKAWFLRYPALTISLYPPIFPMAEAAVFAVFGFSHPAAQATVAAFTALAAYGAYLTARTAVPALAAAGFALVLFAAPGVLLWSRQVMMEIPSLAFLLVGAAALLRYQAAGGTWRLLLAVLMVLAGVYTKQTAIFAAPAFAVALLLGEGPRLLRRRAVWLATLVGVVGLVPLAVFTLMFAPQNIGIAMYTIDTSLRQGGVSDGGAPWHTWVAALLVYARALPGIVGWLPLASALGYLVLVTVRGWRDIAEKRLAMLMLAWFVVDYIFISVVGHFDERYGMALAVPAAVLSVLLVTRLVQERWASMAALAAGAALFAFSLAAYPVHWVEGYGAVAASILDHTAQDDVILFDGNDSKSLVFSLRTRSPKPKVYVLRVEKLLTDYSSFIPDQNTKDRNLSTANIEAMIDHYGISLVVLQPDFWTDQPSIVRLQSLIYSDRFEQIAEFPILAQEQNKRATIKLFRNKTPTKPTTQTIQQMERIQ